MATRPEIRVKWLSWDLQIKKQNDPGWEGERCFSFQAKKKKKHVWIILLVNESLSFNAITSHKIINNVSLRMPDAMFS